MINSPKNDGENIEGSSMYQKLAALLKDAYDQKYAEVKQRQISYFHQVTPSFEISQFLVAFTLHILYFWMLGPFISLFAPCFKATSLFKNMAFFPS